MALVKLGKQEKPVLKLDRTDEHPEYRTKDGTLVPGASTIAGMVPSYGDGLILWGINLYKEGKDFKKVREESGSIGTCTHHLIEAFLKDMEPDLSEFTGKTIKIASQGYDNFLDFWERGCFKPFKSELKLVSENGYGGKLDAVVIDPQDRKVLLDFKTNNYISDGHHVQLAGYYHLFTENFPGEPLDRAGIIKIPKEENKRVSEKWHLDAMPLQFDSFLKGLAFYKSLKAMKRKK